MSSINFDKPATYMTLGMVHTFVCLIVIQLVIFLKFCNKVVTLNINLNTEEKHSQSINDHDYQPLGFLILQLVYTMKEEWVPTMMW